MKTGMVHKVVDLIGPKKDPYFCRLWVVGQMLSAWTVSLRVFLLSHAAVCLIPLLYVMSAPTDEHTNLMVSLCVVCVLLSMAVMYSRHESTVIEMVSDLATASEMNDHDRKAILADKVKFYQGIRLLHVIHVQPQQWYTHLVLMFLIPMGSFLLVDGTSFLLALLVPVLSVTVYTHQMMRKHLGVYRLS